MRFLLLLAVVALAGATQASLFESTTGQHYQHDAGQAGDAPDACGRGRPIEFGFAVAGQLVPQDDPADFYRVSVPDTPGAHAVLVPNGGGAAGPGTPVPADLFVYAVGPPGTCGMLVGWSANPGSQPDAVQFPRGGLYEIEVRLGEFVVGGVKPPRANAPEVCHPLCTASPTYSLATS